MTWNKTKIALENFIKPETDTTIIKVFSFFEIGDLRWFKYTTQNYAWSTMNSSKLSKHERLKNLCSRDNHSHIISTEEQCVMLPYLPSRKNNDLWNIVSGFSYNIFPNMKPTKIYVYTLTTLLFTINLIMGLPMFGTSRIRRSPTGALSPWCSSAFLNFPGFKPRFCPPNPRCKLTISRFLRDCS